MLISEYTMFVAVHLLRGAAAQAPRVRLVATRRAALPEAERAAYEAFLGAPVVCGAPRARLVCDAALLAAPLRAADPELERYFQAVLAAAMPCDDAPELVARAREAIQRELPRGDATVERVAACLALGTRTFQRRLSAEGHTFAGLLDATRRGLAAAYLRDPARTIVEVAYLLGYSEQAAFTRAFRRWYQASPAAWRSASAG
jgi:AraC-like DNA-binding protein